MKFLLFRVKILAFIVKLFSFILKVELPPIVSATALIIKNKKVLVVKLTYRNGYALPGGLSQSGESLEDTLRREVKEETGLNIVEANYFSSFPTGSEFSTVNATYLVKVSGKIKNSNEGVVSWEDPKEIVDKVVYKDCVLAIKKYFDLK